MSEEMREQAIIGLGRTNDIRAIVALKKAAREDEDLRLRNIARQCLLELKKEITAVAPDLFDDDQDQGLNLNRLKAYLSHPDPQVRLNAVRSTLTHKDKMVVGLLQAHYGDETDPAVKGAILIAMGILGRADVVHFISGLLKTEREPLARKGIVEGLSYTQDVRVFPIILKVFASDRDKVVERACLKVLNKLGKNNLLQLLEKMVTSARVSRRQVAARAMGRFSSDAVVALLERAAADDDEETRAYARASLERLARHGNDRASAARRKLPEPVRPEAMASPGEESELIAVGTFSGLDDLDPQARLRAIQEIANSQDATRLPILREQLGRESEGSVKAALVTAISRLGGRAVAGILKDCLKDPIDRVRANAVEALAKIGDDANFSIFMKMLADKDPRTRANAVVALKKCPYVDTAQYIQQMVDSSDERMVRSALHAIVEVGSEKAVAILAVLIGGSNPTLREKATQSLDLLKERGNTAAKRLAQKLDPDAKDGSRRDKRPVSTKAAVPPPAPVVPEATDDDDAPALPPKKKSAAPRLPPVPVPEPVVEPEEVSQEHLAETVEASPDEERPRGPGIIASPSIKAPDKKKPAAAPAAAPEPPPGPPPPPGQFKIPFDTSKGLSMATAESFFKWFNSLPSMWRIAVFAVMMVWGMVVLMYGVYIFRGEDL